MTRIFEKRARRSPLLVGSLHKNWDNIGKQKMIRLSIRKLKKLGDPESGLCKAVLINNTLETVKRNSSSSMTNSFDVEQRSQYTSEEERILANVRLQPEHHQPVGQYNSQHSTNNSIVEEFSSSPVITSLPEPLGPISDDEETSCNNSPSPTEKLQDSVAQSESPCIRNEYLLEDDRAIFNSYLSLCSSELSFECNKSIVAA